MARTAILDHSAGDVTRAVALNAWQVLQTSDMSLQPSSGPQIHRGTARKLGLRE